MGEIPTEFTELKKSVRVKKGPRFEGGRLKGKPQKPLTSYGRSALKETELKGYKTLTESLGNLNPKETKIFKFICQEFLASKGQPLVLSYQQRFAGFDMLTITEALKVYESQGLITQAQPGEIRITEKGFKVYEGNA